MSTSFRTETDGLSGAIAFANIDNIKLVNTGPELLGVPKAPTAAVGIDTTQVATTAFVNAAIASAAATGGLKPSDATPIMNALIPAPGTATAYSRGDHVHQTDNKVVKKTGDTMTGDLVGTNFIAGSGSTSSTVGAGTVVINGTTPALDFKHNGVTSVHMFSYLDNLTIQVGGFEAVLDNLCTWFARGYRTRLGVNGGYDNHSFNISYGSVPNLWIDNTNLGQISIVSDARIKHEVQAMPPATEQVMLMRPITYRFKDVDMWKDDGIRRYGFIAQELRSVHGLHDTVVGENEALTVDGTIQPLTLDTTQLIAVLTKALQETIARVDELEAKCAG